MDSGHLRVATRYDKLAGNYLAFLQLASIGLWLRANETAPWLDIVVEMELVGMRAQPDGVDLLFPLVVEPGFDHVGGEHIAA